MQDKPAEGKVIISFGIETEEWDISCEMEVDPDELVDGKTREAAPPATVEPTKSYALSAKKTKLAPLQEGFRRRIFGTPKKKGLPPKGQTPLWASTAMPSGV